MKKTIEQYQLELIKLNESCESRGINITFIKEAFVKFRSAKSALRRNQDEQNNEFFDEKNQII